MIPLRSSAVVLCTCAVACSMPAIPCRADLFAISTSTGDLYRIDSTTLEIAQIYDNPFWAGAASLAGNLAFDGRFLSWTSNEIGVHHLYQLDVTIGSPNPTSPIFLIPPNEHISGLGALSSMGFDPLLAVTRPAPPTSPSTFYSVNRDGIAWPLGELPIQYQATGLDVDLTSGEIWVSTVSPQLFRADLLRVGILALALPPLTAIAQPEEAQPLAASVIIEQILPLPFDLPNPYRGVAFDDGKMFVVTSTRMISEVDRTTGAILRTVQLPIAGTVGGLTGGHVVPEPTGAVMTLIAAALVSRRRRSRR